MLTAKGWSRRFDQPIPLPRGGELVTLEDAGTYITKLPKAEHEAPEWQAGSRGAIAGRDVGRTDDACADKDDASLSVVTNNSARSPLRKATKKHRIVC
jgi:hypothetical protein